MKSKLQNDFIFAALILCAVSAFGQTEREIEDKYGKPIKAYSMDDSIWMSAEYASDGQVCRMTLFPKRFSDDTIYFYKQLSSNELKRVLDNIAPQSERGQRGALWGLSLIAGGVDTAIYDYEKVAISVRARIGFVGNKEREKNGLETKERNASREENEELANPDFRNAEIVVIIWKDRKCNEQNTATTPKAADKPTP